MSRRPGASGNPLPAAGRQNEYFVPRDGIDREVITADICRYLGNDALVRPGTYENPQTGQLIQGYFINAYRNLTTAMIDDLKADSARWEQERRQQSARSNTGGVQYRNSETHSSRQYYGPTEGGQSGFTDNNPAYDNGPRYPGTGSPGYTGAANPSYYAQQQQPTPQGGFVGQPGYSSQAAAQYASTQPGNIAYSGHPPTQEAPYITGANYANARTTPVDPYGPAGDQFSSSRDSRDMRDPRVPVSSSMAPSRTAYATSGPSTVPAGAYSQSGSGSYYPQGTPAATSQYPVQPQDAFFGRGSAAGTTSYSQEPQYETTPAPSRTPTTATTTQMPPSGSSSSRTHNTSHRERDRDSVDRVDRHTESRHGHRHRSGR